MKNVLSSLLVFCVVSSARAAYTEFYTDFTNGDNLNSGSSTNAAATISYVSSIVANGWDSTTGIFTVSAGNPSSAGIPLNEWASVYVTAGATVATFVARITATNDTTITVSLTAKSGTAPATDALGATTIRVGGVWKGPNAAVSFPFGFVRNTMTNLNSGVASGLAPRVNLKATATYAITALVTNAQAGPILWQGMSAWGTPGDLGKATIDCATVGAGVGILTGSGANNDYLDLIISNSGATSGSTDGFVISGNENTVTRCVAHNVRRDGFSPTGSPLNLVECEAYLCNQNNTSSHGGYIIGGGGAIFLIRCFSHDMVGSFNNGFVVTGQAMLVNCIADTCGLAGFTLATTSGASLIGCDSYNNTGSGIDITSATVTSVTIQNCNLIKNGGWGINSSGGTSRNGLIMNCGFGVGTQVNVSGDIATTLIGAMLVSGSVSYPTGLTPWVDPANGDFGINLPRARAAGRGTFTQTQAAYAGTVAYPDIGAGQHRPAVLSYPFSQ
jgi:hypothetical protein